MSLIKANTIKPVTSGADLSLQGDSGGSAVDCLNITSAGDVDFSGNTDAKIKLPSAGGIYESDGTTAILTESGGAVTLDNVALGAAVTGMAGNLVKTGTATLGADVTISSGTAKTTILSATFDPDGGTANASTVYAFLKFYVSGWSDGGSASWYLSTAISGDDITNVDYTDATATIYLRGSAINLIFPVTLDGSGHAALTYVFSLTPAHTGNNITIGGDGSFQESWIYFMEVE